MCSPILVAHHLPSVYRLKDTANATYKMTRIHKRLADSYIRVAAGVAELSLGPKDPNAQ